MQAVILAAGKGTRMRSQLIKVLHPILGEPVLEHVLRTLLPFKIKEPRIIVGNNADQVCSFLEDYASRTGTNPKPVWQKQQRGTGHAVLMTEKSFRGVSDDILIWPGDMPLLKTETLRSFVREHRKKKSVASVLSSIQDDPTGYGRILRQDGNFYAIREEVDASADERKVCEVNSGVFLFKKEKLFKALKKVKPSNKKKELYLTDVMEILLNQKEKIHAFPLASIEEGLGINDRKDLAAAIEVTRKRTIQEHQEKGVTFVSPEQTIVERGAVLGQDTVIYPWSYIESGVKVGNDCQVGPAATLRRGTIIEEGSVIGNFVEVTRSRVGKKVLAKHLTYIGDAVVGDKTNIGAGTITANFDGKLKHKTKLGKANSIGSNTVLVAPVKLADQVVTGAGSVVTGKISTRRGDVIAGVPARSLKSKKRGK